MSKEKPVYKEIRQIKVSADSYVGLIFRSGEGFSYPYEIIFWTDCTPWYGNSLASCLTNEKEAESIMSTIESIPEKTRENIVETILNHVAAKGGSIRRVDKGWKGISYVCKL